MRPGPPGRGRRPAAPFTPIRLVTVELAEPLADLAPAVSHDGTGYRRAQAFVRLHHRPLGRVEVDLDVGGQLRAAALAAAIWSALAGEVDAHLAADGLEPVTALPVGGLGWPPCAEAPPTADPTPVSVVVPTRDRPDTVCRCVDSILRSDHRPMEILVVDNAPSSQATAAALQARFGHVDQVRYLREDRPGSSSARNRGLAAADGAIVAFTDDDVLVDPHWLAALAGGFRTAEGVDCVTGLLLPAELETPAQLWYEQYDGDNLKSCRRRAFDLGEHRGDHPLYPFTPGMFGAGVNMAFRTSALRALGGFDPALGNGTSARGGEDIDVLLRLVLGGATLVYEPAAIVFHHHHRDYAALQAQVYSYGVGLSAMLTRSVLHSPRLAGQLLARLPKGLDHMLSPTSAKNVNKGVGYPRELSRQELRGLLAGPSAYLRARWALRQRLAG
jgi:glycosyltransferase involved in cell wall biosynthesis